jgi:hypothetical protein
VNCPSVLPAAQKDIRYSASVFGMTASALLLQLPTVLPCLASAALSDADQQLWCTRGGKRGCCAILSLAHFYTVRGSSGSAAAAAAAASTVIASLHARRRIALDFGSWRNSHLQTHSSNQEPLNLRTYLVGLLQ